MAEDDDNRRTPVPSFITTRIASYLNTCEVMEKLRCRGLVLFAVLIPLFFWVRADDLFLAAFESAGAWGFLWLLSTFVNFQYRQIRAASVTEKIDTHIPPGHESREEVIAWIARQRSGSRRGRNTLLAELGSPLGTALQFAGSMQADGDRAAVTTTNAEGPRPEESTAAMIDRRFGGVLAQFGVAAGSRRQTEARTYTYSTTRVFRDGKWETVDETSGGDLLHDPPEELIQEALERLNEPEPPAGFEPIPVSPVEDPETERKRRRKKKRWGRGKRHMPLEIDRYEPDDTDAGPGAGSGE
jgi:hypothetical protein